MYRTGTSFPLESLRNVLVLFMSKNDKQKKELKKVKLREAMPVKQPLPSTKPKEDSSKKNDK